MGFRFAAKMAIFKIFFFIYLEDLTAELKMAIRKSFWLEIIPYEVLIGCVCWQHFGELKGRTFVYFWYSKL